MMPCRAVHGVLPTCAHRPAVPAAGGHMLVSASTSSVRPCVPTPTTYPLSTARERALALRTAPALSSSTCLISAVFELPDKMVKTRRRAGGG